MTLGASYKYCAGLAAPIHVGLAPVLRWVNTWLPTSHISNKSSSICQPYSATMASTARCSFSHSQTIEFWGGLGGGIPNSIHPGHVTEAQFIVAFLSSTRITVSVISVWALAPNLHDRQQNCEELPPTIPQEHCCISEAGIPRPCGHVQPCAAMPSTD